MSAGCLLIQEAGGRAGSTRGEEYNVRVLDTIGTNGKIHDELLRVLKEAHADRVDSSDCVVCFVKSFIEVSEMKAICVSFLQNIRGIHSYYSILIVLDHRVQSRDFSQ